jgi:hypothetical protein
MLRLPEVLAIACGLAAHVLPGIRFAVTGARAGCP